MKKFFKGNNFFHIILLILCISIINGKYKEIVLKLKKGEPNFDLPLYIETTDSCTKWVPALFSPLLIINYKISTDGYSITKYNIEIQNPDSFKETKKALNMNVFKYNISIFSDIYIAQSKINWPKYCRFGLDYSDYISSKQNINAIKNLIPNQIDKNIFSFGKWDLTKQDSIYSSFYIGDSHENFLGEVGSCNIQNDSKYYGCIFNDFVFLNETYSLMDENNKSYIIYFSSEFNKVYFPKNFENKIKNCQLNKNDEFICDELKNKDYLPLKLRADNMNITLEVDKVNRFYDYQTDSDCVTNILFHDTEYIIFPLIMLKNFHTQFDVDKKLISFFSNDSSILEIKRKEPDKTQEPQKDDSDGISTGLLVLLIILGILLIVGLGYGGFLLYKKKHLSIEKKFNKYSRFEDEEGDHSLVN